ncbi:MAG: hypothetical protein KKD35_00295 [Elusimicrobia bacterium]|nr:hypothetical protein [Elusimicrobiota bacterium]
MDWAIERTAMDTSSRIPILQSVVTRHYVHQTTKAKPGSRLWRDKAMPVPYQKLCLSDGQGYAECCSKVLCATDDHSIF